MPSPVLAPAPLQPKAENTEFGAFSRRVIRAYARRIGNGDLDGLADLIALRDAVDEAIDAAVIELRSEPHSHSWRAIAERVGISKRAAIHRWATVAARPDRAGGQPYRLR